MFDVFCLLEGNVNLITSLTCELGPQTRTINLSGITEIKTC